MGFSVLLKGTSWEKAAAVNNPRRQFTPARGKSELALIRWWTWWLTADHLCFLLCWTKCGLGGWCCAQKGTKKTKNQLFDWNTLAWLTCHICSGNKIFWWTIKIAKAPKESVKSATMLWSFKTVICLLIWSAAHKPTIWPITVIG